MARSGPAAQLDRKALDLALDRIDQALLGAGAAKQQLVVLGGAAMLFYGHPGRFTHDIDVWGPSSKFNKAALARACAVAGIGFQPEEEKTLTPYLQIMVPPTVRLPPESTWIHRSLRGMMGDRLQVLMPPPSLVAASKLTRSSPQDLADIIYLLDRGLCSKVDIAREVDRLPSDLAENASENLVYLEVLREPALRQRYAERAGELEGHDMDLAMGGI